MVAGWEGCGEVIVREFGMNIYTLLYFKWITKGLYSTGNSVQMLYGSLDGRGDWGRMDTSICVAVSLYYPAETIKSLLIGYTPLQNKKLKQMMYISWCLGPWNFPWAFLHKLSHFLLTTWQEARVIWEAIFWKWQNCCHPGSSVGPWSRAQNFLC